MTLWHGTIKAYADGIQREGLHPSPERAFHVNHLPVPNGIYLTPVKAIAEGFAYWRRDYSQIPPGVDFDFGMWKNKQGQLPLHDVDLTPVVVRFDVPEGLLALEHDRDSGDFEAFVCTCEIPPQYVKAVEAV